MTYREEKLFLELDLNQEFRKGGAYLLPPVKYTNSASWLCQECSKIQGLDATTATGLLPLIESKCSWVVGAWSTITLGALVNLRWIKENQKKNQVILKCTPLSLIPRLSHPLGVPSLSHMLESPTNSHSQHHILGFGNWNQSGSDYCQVLGKGK